MSLNRVDCLYLQAPPHCVQLTQLIRRDRKIKISASSPLVSQGLLNARIIPQATVSQEIQTNCNKIITVKVLDKSQSQFDDIKEEPIPSARNMAAAVFTNLEEKSRRNKAAEKKLWEADEELLILRLRKQAPKLDYETPLLNKEAAGFRCEAARGGRKQKEIKVQRRGRKMKNRTFETHWRRTWD